MWMQLQLELWARQEDIEAKDFDRERKASVWMKRETPRGAESEVEVPWTSGGKGEVWKQ